MSKKRKRKDYINFLINFQYYIFLEKFFKSRTEKYFIPLSFVDF